MSSQIAYANKGSVFAKSADVRTGIAPVHPSTLAGSCVYDPSRDRQHFPLAVPPQLAAGEMGNLNFGTIYNGVPMKFTKIQKIFRFAQDIYGKTKGQLTLSVVSFP